MGPDTRNLGIPHIDAPSLSRGVCKDRELFLERSDRDSRGEKRQCQSRSHSTIRPEAQLSDPMDWDTCAYDRTGWENIWHARATISLTLHSRGDTLP